MISFVKGKADGQLPIHQLTNPLTLAWIMGGDARKHLASELGQQYSSGCSVASAAGYIIALIAPNGTYRELAPPFHAIKKHELANKPAALECYCQDWYYPECEGPWRLMARDEHHPMCFFDKTATAVFVRAGTQVQKRPDAWVKAREEIRRE
jgi:hypothetical protein